MFLLLKIELCKNELRPQDNSVNLIRKADFLQNRKSEVLRGREYQRLWSTEATTLSLGKLSAEHLERRKNSIGA